ncbi:TonB-dependent receptor domain-containing protein [Limibacterium fermenti]|uniref:TonB-dependent receptor n=1 Tax=Limibacterium fermenti TaxID=3229863 RepID=UPI003A636874
MQKIALLFRFEQILKQNNRIFLLPGLWIVLLLLPQTIKSQDLATVKINLNIDNVSIKDVFAEIQKQSSIKFVYGEDVNKYASVKVSIKQGNISVKAAITEALGSTNLRYTQKGEHVLIDEKPAAAAQPANEPRGQGSGNLKGRVVEAETSEPLPGATVRILGTDRGTMTDLDGYYSFDNVPAGHQTIEVAYMGYTTQPVTVNIPANRTATYDVTLSVDSKLLDEVVISSVRRQRSSVPHMTEKLMVQEIKALQVVASGISSEQISRTADRNAADAVAKVSGVSIRDNKFVVVRGMNERYNLNYLNDNVAPSTEINSRAFALNLIPTRVIDKIVVYKSPSADLLSDMTGGAVKIYTKDATAVRHFDLDVQLGVRENSTFKDLLTYKGGKYDILGFDDGTRALPKSVPGYGNFSRAQISQQTYAESFSNILEYGKVKALPDVQITANYYDAFSVFGKTLSMLSSLSYKKESQGWQTDRMQGFLKASHGEIPIAINSVYNDHINNDNAQLSLLQNFSLRLNDRHSLRFKNFLLQQGQDQTITRISAGPFVPNESTGTQELLGGLWDYSTSIKGRKKNVILSYTQRFLYSGNFSGEHRFGGDRHRLEWNAGYIFTRQDMPDQRVLRFDNMRNGRSYNGVFPDYNWVALERATHYEDGLTDLLMGKVSRSWTRNTEQSGNFALDYTWNAAKSFNVKLGTYSQYRHRTLYRRTYTLNEGDLNSAGYIEGGMDDWQVGAGSDYMDYNRVYYTEQDLWNVWSTDYLKDDGSALKVFDRTSGSDSYKADEQLHSGYALFNLKPLGEKLDVSLGLRVEYDRQQVASAYVSPNDRGGVNAPLLVDNEITDWLPSGNVSYKPTGKWVFRAAYGQSLNRPEFREMSSFSETDYLNGQTIRGNSGLVRSKADNYDLRAEWYPYGDSKSDMLSIGGFYKTIEKPIERTVTKEMAFSYTLPVISWRNGEEATIKGVEVELRKDFSFIPGKIFSDLSVIANYTWLHSEVTVQNRGISPDGSKIIDTFITRKLQGQAPYILNAGLYYDNAGSGTKAALIFNRIGERIYAASTGYLGTDFSQGQHGDKGYLGSQIELADTQMDFSLTQRVGKGISLKFSIQNLLDKSTRIAEDSNFTYKYEPNVRFSNEDAAYGVDYGNDIITNEYKTGRFYSLSFSYSF